MDSVKSTKFAFLIKIGTTILSLILIFSVCCISVFADQQQQYIDLMSPSSIIQNTTSIAFGGDNITSYTLSQSSLIDVDISRWPLGPTAWRSTITINSWADTYAESYKMGTVQLTNTFRIPTLIPSDEQYFVFTLYSRLSSSTYTSPIEDSAVLIEGQSFYPTKITQSTTGNYYTYAIDLSNLSNPTQMDISVKFGDWDTDVPDQLGRTFHITFQMSEVTVTHSLSATNQYLQDLNSKIEDLSSKLDVSDSVADDAINSNDQLDNSITQGENVLSSIPEVTTPSPSKLSEIFNYENLQPGEEALYLADMIKPIMSDTKVENLMLISASIALGSYVLFGKKG